MAQVSLVAQVLFPQQACLCHRENLDKKVPEDPRVTLAHLEPLEKG